MLSWLRTGRFCTVYVTGVMRECNNGEHDRGLMADEYRYRTSVSMTFYYPTLGISDRVQTNDRTTARFDWILQILNVNSFILKDVDFWGHNDADMLEVRSENITRAETRTHFALWAAMKSPLIIGTDLRKLSLEDADVLLNPYLLALNQDPIYGAPAKPYRWGLNPDWTWNMTNPAEYWSGESRVGTLVLMLNTLGESRNMTADLNEIPSLKGKGAFKAVDVWTGEDIGEFDGAVTMAVESHDTAVLLFRKSDE